MDTWGWYGRNHVDSKLQLVGECPIPCLGDMAKNTGSKLYAPKLPCQGAAQFSFLAPWDKPV
eukprot:9772312-Prorocentrum_lima.AAC.1